MKKNKVVISSLFFVLGFSLIFTLMGATATSLGTLLSKYKILFSQIAGIIIIIFGLHLMGILKIPLLYMEKRYHFQKLPSGYLGAFIMGLAFAFGWTPCIGPILGGILVLASNQKTVLQGTILLFIYSLGLGIPFIITAFTIKLFFSFLNKLKKHFHTIEVISGILLILIGIAMIFGGLEKFAYLMKFDLAESYSAKANYITAFIGGFLSFISPCVMPLIPGYISFISGISASELMKDN